MAQDDIVLDLTNFKDTQGGYVPPGKYAAIIEDAERGESNQKKTPEITLWLRIVGGDYDGIVLVEHLYISKGAMFRIVNFLTALSIKWTKTEMRLKASQFVNRRVIIEVDDDEYNNRVRSRIQGYERLTGTVSSGADIDSLDGLQEFAGLDPAATDLPDVDEPAVEVASELPEKAPEAPVVSKPSEIGGGRTESEIGKPAQAAPVAVDEDEEAIDLDEVEGL